MSGIFGIFNRNGNPVDKTIAEDMLESMSSWGADECDLWIDGSIALGHAMLWNTPESKSEHLPLQKDTHIITMDARIDNRDELAKELDLPKRSMSEIGDSEFILAAYQKWGEKCPKHLLGDFSFAIWDKKKDQLFCVRDHIGIKPFFYFQSDDFFIFSNDISVLLQHPQIPQEFDDLTIADFAKDWEMNSRNATFFKKIKALPSATSIMVSEKEIKKNTYWKIEESPSIRYKSFQEYTKKLRELFDDAVKVRLRSNYTLASHLSGGIDSSPIAVCASRELVKQGKHLHTFNWIDIPEDPNKYEFEAWNFSRRIATREENMIHEEFSIDPQFIAKQYEIHNIFTQGTMYTWGEYYIQEQMKKMDARVMLSGWGGDELISYNGYSYISGLFTQWKIATALYYYFKNIKYHPFTLSKWIKLAVKSILPPDIFKILRKIVKPHAEVLEEYEIDNYIYMMDTFKKFAKLQPNAEYPTIKGVRKRQFALHHFGHIQRRTESWALSGFSKKMEYRYPLLDKRIVEFSIGIPEKLFYPQKGKERPLFKTAISDLLPLDIVWFNKPYESKINKANKENYAESLNVLQRKINYRKLDDTCNFYFDYGKINHQILNFDFKQMDVNELGNVVFPILFLNSKRKLKKNTK